MIILGVILYICYAMVSSWYAYRFYEEILIGKNISYQVAKKECQSAAFATLVCPLMIFAVLSMYLQDKKEREEKDKNIS